MACMGLSLFESIIALCLIEFMKWKYAQTESWKWQEHVCCDGVTTYTILTSSYIQSLFIHSRVKKRITVRLIGLIDCESSQELSK